MGEPPRSSRAGVWRWALTALVLGLTFAYLALTVGRHWRELGQLDWSLRWDSCLLSFLLAGSWFAGRALLWQRVLSDFGHPLRYREAFRMWSLSELGRYLPGKVWYALGRGYLAAQKGISAPVAGTAMALELLVVLIGAMLSCLAELGAHSDVLRPLRFALPVALVLALLVVHPRVLGMLLRLARREPPQQLPNLRQMLGMLLISVIVWLAMGASFALFATSLVPLPLAQWPAAASSYAASWSLGLVTVVSPGGLGVRESALNVLLDPLLPTGSAVVVSLASRVWITLAECCCALVALCVGRR